MTTNLHQFPVGSKVRIKKDSFFYRPYGDRVFIVTESPNWIEHVHPKWYNPKEDVYTYQEEDPRKLDFHWKVKDVELVEGD